jgi:hypothetical protein
VAAGALDAPQLSTHAVRTSTTGTAAAVSCGAPPKNMAPAAAVGQTEQRVFDACTGVCGHGGRTVLKNGVRWMYGQGAQDDTS